MTDQFARVRWARVLTATALIYLITMCLVLAIVFGFAFNLGFQARGMPDVGRIREFSSQAIPGIAGILLGVVTFIVVWRGARGLAAASVNGLVIGLVVAVISLAIHLRGGGFGLDTLVAFIPALAGGWLGGALTERR